MHPHTPTHAQTREIDPFLFFLSPPLLKLLIYEPALNPSYPIETQVSIMAHVW